MEWLIFLVLLYLLASGLTPRKQPERKRPPFPEVPDEAWDPWWQAPHEPVEAEEAIQPEPPLQETGETTAAESPQRSGPATGVAEVRRSRPLLRKETFVQGVLWSEILARPRSLRPYRGPSER